MAELISSYAATEILKKLQSVVTDTITGAWGLKGDLVKLSESAERLESLLKKVQYAPAVDDDKSIKRWLDKLQKVVYAAADVVDEFHYEILRRKVEIKSQLKRKLREFVSCYNPILFRVNMAFKVKEVWASLADMEKEAPLVLLTMTVPTMIVAPDHEVVSDSRPDRRTTSFLGGSPIGRTKEAQGIVQMLQIISPNAPVYTVISIVGFGGLGKTTLAKLVFEDSKKKKLFDEMMWVCVSEPFDVQKILGEMLEKLDKTTGGLRSIDVIVGELQQHLKDKRFLLVLDDVWNKDSEKWDNLRLHLENICGKSGNFVLTTTRSIDVANIMKSKYVEELKPLSDRECWNIIQDSIIGISHEMEVIGMEIAKKCGGVPLAAKVLGGLLTSRKNKAEWLSLLDNNIWNEVDKDKRISKVLKLSFDHLPPPQKLCFVYCSLFPKDVVFKKAKLIQLWLAEDFLNTSSANEAKLMEDVGDECFHNLYANSFFQDAEVDDCGNIIRCKMHDLLHDLASSISKSKRLPCGSNCCETSGGRRLNFSCDQVSKVEEILKESEEKKKILRSLFCRVDVSLLLSNFRRLRSLDMSAANLKDLPDEIRKLKYLRYLDISKNENIQKLPESITKLYNLQTLRVFECKNLKELPSNIRNLVSLRHLGIDEKRLMPLEVGCLTNLQTLPFFVVGVEKGQKIDELEGLKELRGEVVICGLENVKDKEEAERARMKEKKLSKLVLQWMKVNENEVEKFSSSEESKHEKVMEGLEAPTSLQSLKMEWYMGKQLPQWMSELHKLVKLRLENCRKCVRMPTLGHLPNLNFLMVERMDSLTSIGTELFGDINNTGNFFPSLEEFSIERMKSLVEWVIPEGREMFPKLLTLRIVDCPRLQSLPLSQLISSPICMQLHCSPSRSSTDFLEILCKYNIPRLKSFQILNCDKVTFPQFGLTSLMGFFFDLGNISRLDEKLVKKFSVSSKELGESWKTLGLEGWVKGIREFPQSLEALEITYLRDALSLEAFHGLPYLKHLVIRHCDHLESIPNLSSLTSLEHLQIGCRLVKSIPTLSPLTSLEHLRIANCDHLESIPNVSSLKFLKELLILICDNLTSVPDGLISCQSLKKLIISMCGKLSELSSFSTLSCLEELSISDCGNLRRIPSDIKSCTSLKALKVAFCKEIVNIDDDIIGSLVQLKKLEWGGFSEEVDEIPGLNSIHLLTSLEKLTINGRSKQTSLPHQLQHLTSVSELEIRWFREMESLPDWLSNLSSLQTLVIWKCDNLKSLPADIQRLSKLTKLHIYDCPLLEERYAKDIGPEWSNISHIPEIYISGSHTRGRHRPLSGELFRRIMAGLQ